MDAIKEALKRHMGKSKMSMHPDEKGGEKKDSDLAPALNSGDAGHQMIAESADHEAKEEDHMNQQDDLLQKIHQAIMGVGSPIGRGSMSLGERASDKVKEKMASIQKHKKSY